MDNEFAERRAAFLKEYADIREKYQADFLGFPAYIPTDRGTFETTMNIDVVDLKALAKPSPFIKS